MRKSDITERQRAEAEITDRLQFETLLAELSSGFVRVRTALMDDEMNDALRRVCESLGLETATLWRKSDTSPSSIGLTHFYGPEAMPSTFENLNIQKHFPWVFEQVKAGRVVSVSSLNKLPAEAARDREGWRQFGVKSNLTIGLAFGGESIAGALSFNTIQSERTWPESLVKRLQTVALLFSNALARQDADRALRESEDRFRGLVENATVGIYRTTPDGRILAANPTLIKMLGYRDFESLAERNLDEEGFEPSYTRKLFCERMQEDGKVIGLEAAWRKQDGSVIVVREGARAVRDQDGKTLFYDGIVEDITERTREEEALRESEARFNQLAEKSRTTTWEVDPQGLFTYVSHVSEASWAYRPDEMVGRMHFYDLHPQEGREAFKDTVFSVVEQMQPFRDVVHAVAMKDGRISWGLTSGFPVFNNDGTLRGYRGSCTDITERKHVEDALRKSEAKYRTVVEMTGTGYHVLDMQGRVLDANQEYVRLTGHSALREILGRSVIEWTAEGAKKRNAEALAQCVRDGVIRSFVTEYEGGNGRSTFIEVNATVEREGQALRIISLCRDVTRQKKHEQAIQQLSRRLINAQEEERTRIARELHDDICQRISLLSAELASQKLAELSLDVQAISHRLHSPKLEYLGLVAAARSICSEISEKQQIEIEFVHSNMPRAVPSDISLCLFRVLQQALQNSVKHSGCRNMKVELRGTHDEIQLTVSDSGTGFDPQEAMGGKGLGLMSMRERLGLVSGRLSIISAPGTGTTIQASVPFITNGDSPPAVG